tara:strand:+ start:295 stop:645 length:351 start_codon:yes stop_codon:yes gene_type:complete
MKFAEVIYYLSLYKKVEHVDNFLKDMVEKIDIPKEEIIRFKFKNKDIIENNKENFISKIKLFENSILEAFVIFYFEKNKICRENINTYSKIIYDNRDPNDTYFSKEFITSINVFPK